MEFDQAIESLEKAHSVDSSNKEVRKLLRGLKDQKLKQKKLDRETFSGMFNRGHVYDDDEASTDSLEDVSEDDTARERKFRKEVRCDPSALRGYSSRATHRWLPNNRPQVNEAEALARMCESKGQTEHAKEIRAKIAEAKAARARRLKQVDFFNPTDEMIEDAKKNGCVGGKERSLHDCSLVSRSVCSESDGLGGVLSRDQHRLDRPERSADAARAPREGTQQDVG